MGVLKLNCGCGNKYLPRENGWVNIDIDKSVRSDLRLDLEHDDLPFPDASVDYVLLQDFLEHLTVQRQSSFLSEVFRVLKPFGEVYIQVPHLRILALRYLGYLDAGMQHKLTTRQFAEAIYSPSENIYATHKWGYDEDSLYAALTKIGFAVSYTRSDGGSNLLASARKPTEWVYIPVGGGLGDVFQVYMSNLDDIPTSNGHASAWFKRLRAIKSKYPWLKVRIMFTSHTQAARDLLNTNPYIDDIVTMAVDGPADRWDYMYSGAANINHLWDYKHFAPDPAKIFLTSDDQSQLAKYKPKGKYIVVHPIARLGCRTVPSPLKYKILIRFLSRLYPVIVLGACEQQDVLQYDFSGNGVINLINKTYVRVAYDLVMNASGFVGVHSSLILGAWYKKIRTVCFVPVYHDDGKTTFADFFASDNPTTWGAKEGFNKTITIRNNEFDISDVVEWFRE